MNNDNQRCFTLPNDIVLIGTIALVATAVILAIVDWLPLINAALLLPFILGLYTLLMVPGTSRVLIAIALTSSFLIGFFIAVYKPIDFNYPLVWNPGPLYEGGSSYSLYINFSKAIAGYLVIVWLCLGMQKNTAQRTFTVRPLWEQWAFITSGMFFIIFIAYIFFDVELKPKWPDGILYFILVNLLVTVFAEEAFFRVLLQGQVERFFHTKTLGVYAGITVSSVLFALAHSGATGAVFFLFLFAGFVYATVYARTRSLTASIATHFGVNIVHLTMLEYPL